MKTVKQIEDNSQNRFVLPDAHMHALKTMLECIPPEGYIWVLTGSASLRLQGVDVPVHDLDIECDLQDILRVEQALFDYMTTPVHLWESGCIRSLDGKAQISGVEIELISELEVLDLDGNWKRLIDFDQRIGLDWQGYQVPVFPLEVEAVASQAMGRDEKANLILETIQRLKEGRHD